MKEEEKEEEEDRLSAFPQQARVVVVGGGIVGCSVAYHLAELGWRDVLLLERKSLTSGTTWHAAGLLGQLRGGKTQTDLGRYSIDLYERLERETGQATGVRRNGTLMLARCEARWVELKRRLSEAHAYELEALLLSPRDAGSYWPLMRIDDLVGALFIPGDGQGDPTGISMALAGAARRRGARIVENTRVRSIVVERGAVRAVHTDRGQVDCEILVNCGGIWAREIGRAAGVSVPLHAVEHMYLVTEPLEGLTPGAPSLRDYDGLVYFKEDAGRLLMGGTEPNARPWGVEGIPEDFHFTLLNEDLEQFQPLIDEAVVRVPALQQVGIRQFLVGPESFTPDGHYILGESPEVRNFFVAAGFNSIGIASAGGAGRALAEWIVNGGSTMDLSDVDIRRFQTFQSGGSYLRARVKEVVSTAFAMHWPHRQMTSARGVRLSPLHERLQARGACFGEAGGWERPNWFAPSGVAARYEYSFGRQNWFDYTADEHRAVRERVALFDETSFAKFQLDGTDACAVLQRLCTRDLDVRPGRVLYTHMLNDRGGIEADITVTRLAQTRFLVVCGAAAAARVHSWMERHIGNEANVILTDVTSAYAVIGVFGPRSRELLARLVPIDLSNDRFAYLTSREIEVGNMICRATRVSFVGELGWELYVPTESAAALYDTLVAAGEDFGLVDAGYHALDSLRIERGFRHYGHDITDYDNPLEAGLGFVVDFEKGSDFIGRTALVALRGKPLRRRLVIFTLADTEALVFHNEPIFRNGVLAGRITSGAYGYTLGCAVALGYLENEGGVDASFVSEGRYEIEVANERAQAVAHLRPPYDPEGERVRL